MDYLVEYYGNNPDAADYLRLASIINIDRDRYEELTEEINARERTLPPDVVTHVRDLDTRLNTLIPQERELQDRLERREEKTGDYQICTTRLTHRIIPFHESQLQKVRTRYNTLLTKLRKLLYRLRVQVKRYEDAYGPLGYT